MNAIWTSYENAKVIAAQRGYKVALNPTKLSLVPTGRPLAETAGWRVRIDNPTTLDCRGFSLEGFIAWAKKD